ncbi:MAG: ATP phosphoribosyltransferase [Actinobacteria bacterium]|jgi:ATP phosphoribosyltransferase|uniref:ATP phosphoribosyltransferase n=1 Tax=Microbacterium TaxID=33882 RepID=UPI000C3C0EC6|nr:MULTISPECIES: ATP phosphoribosyltransferase [unclassified Microbacterium]MEC8761463.1 ATP phosphoribosyltransferase [Actinomycetota bacterium]MBU19514.1 ATP phosphoribosyltransferase [Microbacterium sp.]RUA25709.1 MAG: ATP phosphoribosyltransferase [Actinomycetota bacterium]HAJ18245.1 ATP phosphoribosyltransferase [Microbacterium sp.]HAM13363.1 ATP phosphoribosyltransferase [Microbacterium sp.]|tara:strand:- start:1572 stop:2411 length:840 start_codon:yes stop_codon:yes gene_type:complete
MLRIAVPNKGSLAETSAAMLTEAGYTGRRDPKDLHVIDPANEVEFFYLRPRDIATYVGSGALDVGITGRDLLLDARMPAREVESLGFADSTFRFAGPPGRFTELADLEGMRVATAYPGLVDSFLDERGIAVDLVPLDGAVESAVRLGVADAVADVVSTGTTLKQAGLEIFGPVLLESEAVLIGGPREVEGTETLLRRLRGVMVARRYVLIDYDLPADLVDRAVEIAPGIESPTISPLRDPSWVAVRVMSPRKGVNQVMDALYGIGARAILVTEIHAARL